MVVDVFGACSNLALCLGLCPLGRMEVGDFGRCKDNPLISATSVVRRISRTVREQKNDVLCVFLLLFLFISTVLFSEQILVVLGVSPQ